ncbi:Catalase [Vitis vinifera]|uniref:Catalase n=1 Tax=Vitis vinifera TaxID=29760 RepID=A0A438DBS0_VITVI|nr:Catalase [Vitis vinifera]
MEINRRGSELSAHPIFRDPASSTQLITMDPYKVPICSHLSPTSRRIQADYIFFPYLVQYRPSSAYNSPYFTTNAGAPVYNNDSSLTVGSRGIVVHNSVHVVVGIP